MWERYITANSIADCRSALSQLGASARIVAGATDLMLELERGARKGVLALIDISRVPGLNKIEMDSQQWIHIGPLVTQNDCIASDLLRKYAFPLVQASWEVGSPQIRNRGTIAGNLITASPANDTITPLMALGAQVQLTSSAGDRVVALSDFYSGVRRTVMQPDEMLVDIAFPAMGSDQAGVFIKYALRKAQAISLVNAAIILVIAENGLINQASITLGAVAPTIIHAVQAENYLVGRSLNGTTIQEAAMLASKEARPISDVRASAHYRTSMVKVIVKRGLNAINERKERVGFPELPVLLRTNLQEAETIDGTQSSFYCEGDPIIATINGETRTFTQGQHKSLLRLLREDGLLVGTKEGCAEGECGACTVDLDGMDVMACLVPAPRAHGARIRTVEGLAQGNQLHPVQKAFIDQGAVQCGYCTPGFLMSAAKLLDEYPHPSRDQIQQALTGNLCRCTGYYKIISAIETASDSGGS